MESLRSLAVMAAACCLPFTLLPGGQSGTSKQAKEVWNPLSGKVGVQIVGLDDKPAETAEAWLVLRGGQNPLAVRYMPLRVIHGLVEVDLSKTSPMQGAQVIARDATGAIGSIDAAAVHPSGEGSSERKLRLRPTTSVRGQLIRPNGTSAAGVKVSVHLCLIREPRMAIILKGSPLSADAETDAEGRFTIPAIPDNSLIQLLLSDPSVQQPMKAIPSGTGTAYGFEVGSQPTDLGSIRLTPAGQVSGRITLEGKGLGGVSVSAQLQSAFMPRDGAATPAFGGQTVTDAEGRYVIGGLGNGPYNVAAYLPEDLARDYACAAKEGVAIQVGKEIANQDLILEPGGLVEGQVLLKNGADPEGYPVYYYSADHPDSTPGCGSVRCDSSGGFKIRLAPGRARIYLAAKPEDTSAQAVVAIRSGATSKVTLKQ